MSTYPAIKGKMGKIEYYSFTLPAHELANLARPAYEYVGEEIWDDQKLSERVQRKPSYSRAKKDIATYLLNNEDRFFSSVCVFIHGGEIKFENLQTANIKPLAAYEIPSKSMGFLTITNGQFIALDGQHRIIALKHVINAGEGDKKYPVEGKFKDDVFNDSISVIYINSKDPKILRRIFGDINTYAKAVSIGERLAGSQDDGYAMVMQRLIDEGPFTLKLVNLRGAALGDTVEKITSSKTIYEMVKIILQDDFSSSFKKQEKPSEKSVAEGHKAATEFFNQLLTGVKSYKDSMTNSHNIPGYRTGNQSLIFKPLGQEALVTALYYLDKNHIQDLEKSIKQINKIDWSTNYSGLFGAVTIKRDGSIDAGKGVKTRTTEFIKYLLAGNKLNDDELENIKAEYNKAFNIDIYDLREGQAAKALPEVKYVS